MTYPLGPDPELCLELLPGRLPMPPPPDALRWFEDALEWLDELELEWLEEPLRVLLLLPLLDER